MDQLCVDTGLPLPSAERSERGKAASMHVHVGCQCCHRLRDTSIRACRRLPHCSLPPTSHLPSRCSCRRACWTLPSPRWPQTRRPPSWQQYPQAAPRLCHQPSRCPRRRRRAATRPGTPRWRCCRSCWRLSRRLGLTTLCWHASGGLPSAPPAPARSQHCERAGLGWGGGKGGEHADEVTVVQLCAGTGTAVQFPPLYPPAARPPATPTPHPCMFLPPSSPLCPAATCSRCTASGPTTTTAGTPLPAAPGRALTRRRCRRRCSRAWAASGCPSRAPPPPFGATSGASTAHAQVRRRARFRMRCTWVRGACCATYLAGGQAPGQAAAGRH